MLQADIIFSGKLLDVSNLGTDLRISENVVALNIVTPGHFGTAYKSTN